MEKKNKKQQPPEYTVTARVRGKRERFALLFPCCLDFATERLPELERDPRLWNPPRHYNTGE